MIRKLMVFSLLICILPFSLMAAVDTKLVLESNTHGFPSGSQGTLIIDVMAMSDGDVESIEVYQDKFYLDANLRSQIENPEEDVTFSFRRFPATDNNYNVDEAYNTGSPAGRVKYAYSYNTGSRNTISNSEWTLVVRVTIVYNLSGTTSTVAWGNDVDLPQWNVTDESLNDLDGSHEAIPAGLTDISLPVHSTAFSAMSVEGQGIQITWNTESEVNSLGFHIWRKTSEESEYRRITNEIIPGKGDGSQGAEYIYLDENVYNEIEYWYKIEEISLDGTSLYIGPIKTVGTNITPTEFGLSANYPNPFNPITNFNFQISETVHTTIRVYNLLGKMVKELVNESLEPGNYTDVQWDGTDTSGNQVTSGIYFLHMQAGNYKKMQKMTLVR